VLLFLQKGRVEMKIIAVIKPGSINEVARLMGVEDLYSCGPAPGIELQVDITKGNSEIPHKDIDHYIVQV
jgi:hypothetical protein